MRNLCPGKKSHQRQRLMPFGRERTYTGMCQHSGERNRKRRRWHDLSVEERHTPADMGLLKVLSAVCVGVWHVLYKERGRRACGQNFIVLHFRATASNESATFHMAVARVITFQQQFVAGTVSLSFGVEFREFKHRRTGAIGEVRLFGLRFSWCKGIAPYFAFPQG